MVDLVTVVAVADGALEVSDEGGDDNGRRAARDQRQREVLDARARRGEVPEREGAASSTFGTFVGP